MTQYRYHVRVQLVIDGLWSILYSTDELEAARAIMRNYLTNPHLVGLEIYDADTGELV